MLHFRLAEGFYYQFEFSYVITYNTSIISRILWDYSKKFQKSLIFQFISERLVRNFIYQRTFINFQILENCFFQFTGINKPRTNIKNNILVQKHSRTSESNPKNPFDTLEMLLVKTFRKLKKQRKLLFACKKFPRPVQYLNNNII